MLSIDTLEAGRQAFARQAWREAHEALWRADRDEYVRGLQCAHREHLETGDELRAVRCTFCAGITLMLGGETCRAARVAT